MSIEDSEDLLPPLTAEEVLRGGREIDVVDIVEPDDLSHLDAVPSVADFKERVSTEQQLSIMQYAMKYPHRIRAEACRRSLFEFVKEFWYIISEEEPIWNWHIEYLCQELQIVANQVFARKEKLYDLIINIPPGTTKSTVCTIMFPAWCWIPDATLQFMTCSYSSALSLQHADKSREIIRSDKYRLYFPHIEIREDKDLKSCYANTKRGERFTTSVGGSATGMHAHIIIVDDPLNPQQSVSEADRTTANRWIANTLSTRKVNKAMTPTILIMQRTHIDDPTADLLAKRQGHKIKHICLPAEVSEDVKPIELCERYIDGLLDPLRLNREVLRQLELDLGPYDYAAQIKQNPISRSGQLFDAKNFIIHQHVVREDIVKSVRYWDKAGTQDGGMYTAGVLIHRLKNGMYLIEDVVRGQWEAALRERKMRLCAESDGPRVIQWVEQEPGSGGKESAQNTQRVTFAGYVCKIEKVTGEKSVRAEPYAVQVEAGNVILLDRPWTKDFMNEHIVYPGKFKDQVDAASGGFNKIALPKSRAGAWEKQQYNEK